MELELRRLHAANISEEQMSALTGVVLAAPAYSLLVEGRLPVAEEVPDLLSDLPPNYSYDDKYFFGIYQGERMIGCADLLKGWKTPQQSMLGLLLFAEDVRGQGYGRQVYLKLEQIVASWPGMNSIRIGVISTNLGGLAFWRKMGFAENGERYKFEQYLGDTVILEKALSSG
ncbi:GNAT family N-acetyltransferase [Undibacterium terreum]|nr:GNAT family N-acetyltransferase [Undibacterium terreum]